MTELPDNSIFLPAPKQGCDLVMKGGITSGVVYPRALCEIAKKYRFVNIGGTSAGAMAAAAAAAAEYGRDKEGGGFARLAQVPEEVGENLLSLFQPAPALTPIFNIFVSMLKGGNAVTRTLRALVWAAIGYWPSTIFGLLVGGGVAWGLVYLTDGSAQAYWLFCSIFAIVVATFVLSWRVYWALTRELPAREFDFGLCSGKSVFSCSRSAPPAAFTDWLHALVNELAGRTREDPPLTFGDISSDDANAIKLQMMTTNLMECRPYSLPMENNNDFFFEIGEWSRLFPKTVIDSMVDGKEPISGSQGEPGKFYAFPDEEKLPIIVAARMSLSFPLLISAVPLWRKDKTYKEPGDRDRLQRCLFSDGGISSNFPIHFFDGLFPRRPTFAISLEKYNSKKHEKEWWLAPLDEFEPKLPVQEFGGLLGFLLRIVDSAKDWQDNLQSLLPGYRERIVFVGLDDNQGGLNVTMDREVVKGLAERGEEAAKLLLEEFADSEDRWNEHRWRRYLVAQARLGATLGKAAGVLSKKEDGWADFLGSEYFQKPKFFVQDKETMEKFRIRTAAMSALCSTLDDVDKDKIPKPDTDLRITAKP